MKYLWIRFAVLVLVLFHAEATLGQVTEDLSFLLTAPELTSFNETTGYDEAIAFLTVASAQHPDLHVSSFGYSTEGRALPLVVYGDVSDASAEEVLRSGKLRVFIQANIHAGEVCGKEALLMMIRGMAEGKYDKWTDSLVIIMAPIYNVDGNERINLFNRPRQNGPHAGMGIRNNAQGLDLNRDHMKVKSPETRSLIRFFNEYDPHVVIDLHTTNGTRHAYHLTYASPLNPNTAASIVSYLRNTWLPHVTASIRERVGWEYYFYGNLPFRSGEAAWYTFDSRPRFNNNYVGLRNRMAILSEAYAYSTFEDRILSSLYFVEENLNFAAANRSEIDHLIQRVSSLKLAGQMMGVRFRPSMNAKETTILMGDIETRINQYSGAVYFERKDTVFTSVIPEYGAFETTEWSRMPEKYYVSSDAAVLVSAYLDTHGIEYQVLSSRLTRHVDAFIIDSTWVSRREFQQLNERTVLGSFSETNVEFAPGSLLITTDQTLSRLLFYLLEPRSDDGLLNWAQMDRWVEKGMTYPVYKSID